MKKMTEIIISAVLGLLVGGGSVALALKPKKEDPKPVESIAQDQQEVIKQLTNFDLTLPICSPEYIKEKGNLLCRELTCLQFSRGIDSETGGSQCEQISNIANKIEILDKCSLEKTPEKTSECLEIFWRRN